MRNAYTPVGYQIIDQDVSEGAGGLYAYITYRMGKSDTDIINDIQAQC